MSVTTYRRLEAKLATRLINAGPVVWVCTRGADGRDDLAPVAWHCPTSKEPPRLLLVVGRRHQTYRNLADTKACVVAVPRADQAEAVRATGRVSGAECDKWAGTGLASFRVPDADVRVPEGCLGFLTCRVETIWEQDRVGIVLASVLRADADAEGFDGRILTERPAGKTLHHLGDHVFAVPGGDVIAPPSKGRDAR